MSYGTPPPPPQMPQYPGTPGYPPVPGNSGKAIGALVLGICSIVFGWICCGGILGMVLGGVAIFLAVAARREIDVNPQLGGRGMATAGLITGIVGAVLGAIILIVVIALAASGHGSFSYRT